MLGFKLCLIVWLSVAAVMTSFTQAASEPSDGNARSKRAVESCDAKFRITSGHTACFPGTKTPAVTPEERREIVDQHNRLRASVTPTASNMMLLRWDDEVAMVAQKWANTCPKFPHPHDKNRGIPGRFSLGQNMAINSGWLASINAWHSEVRDFTYGDPSVNAKIADIGHYTQVVWAATTLIGCGMKKCGPSKVYICNYAPAGNYGGQLHLPYKRGTSCADCPGHCKDNLCDCSLTCLNGGKLYRHNCTCNCQMPAPLHMVPDCALNCTGGSDKWFCPTQGKCPGHGVWCPHKCKLCPYAGVDYRGPPPNMAETLLVKWSYLTLCAAIVMFVF